MVAFSRNHRAIRAVVVVPRLPMILTRGTARWPIAEVWGGQTLELPNGTYSDVFTGRSHEVQSSTLNMSAVLADFPVALLTCVAA